jgi:hypothetical protein
MEAAVEKEWCVGHITQKANGPPGRKPLDHRRFFVRFFLLVLSSCLPLGFSSSFCNFGKLAYQIPNQLRVPEEKFALTSGRFT